MEWVIIFEGINDLGNNGSLQASTITDAFSAMADRAHGAGKKVIGATIMPCNGTTTYNCSGFDATRNAINDWIRTTDKFDGVIDFDDITRSASDPSRLSDEVNGAGTCPVGGDWLHPCPGGYAIMGNGVDLTLFQ